MFAQGQHTERLGRYDEEIFWKENIGFSVQINQLGTNKENPITTMVLSTPGYDKKCVFFIQSRGTAYNGMI